MTDVQNSWGHDSSPPAFVCMQGPQDRTEWETQAKM